MPMIPNDEFSVQRFRQDVEHAKATGRIADAFFVCDAEIVLAKMDEAVQQVLIKVIRDNPPKLSTGTVHDLKCWPNFFDVINDGTKPFEIRSEVDRRFAVGDMLLLREWDPASDSYTGRSCGRRVSYILRGFPGIEPDYAILGFPND